VHAQVPNASDGDTRSEHEEYFKFLFAAGPQGLKLMREFDVEDAQDRASYGIH
jgi:hypothetical protein